MQDLCRSRSDLGEGVAVADMGVEVAPLAERSGESLGLGRGHVMIEVTPPGGEQYVEHRLVGTIVSRFDHAGGHGSETLHGPAGAVSRADPGPEAAARAGDAV